MTARSWLRSRPAPSRDLIPAAAVRMTLVYGEGGATHWVLHTTMRLTFKMKIDYANNNCLGGTMVWAACSTR